LRKKTEVSYCWCLGFGWSCLFISKCTCFAVT